MKRELGLNVDKPTQGSGNSNTGNTARKFFCEYVKVAEITKIDENLIYRFWVILSIINGTQKINTSAYSAYAKETAVLYVNLYGWFYMPLSVHKLLIHGSQMIDSLIIPVGQASEEGMEARHKDIRNARSAHSCKISRKRSLQDLMNWLLATSDPVIATTMRKQVSSKKSVYTNEMLSLLANPN